MYIRTCLRSFCNCLSGSSAGPLSSQWGKRHAYKISQMHNNTIKKFPPLNTFSFLENVHTAHMHNYIWAVHVHTHEHTYRVTHLISHWCHRIELYTAHYSTLWSTAYVHMYVPGVGSWGGLLVLKPLFPILLKENLCLICSQHKLHHRAMNIPNLLFRGKTKLRTYFGS